MPRDDQPRSSMRVPQDLLRRLQIKAIEKNLPPGDGYKLGIKYMEEGLLRDTIKSPSKEK